MKQLKAKRISALLLALVMVISLVGCANNNGGSSSKPTGDTSDTSTAPTATDDGPLTPYEEPVKITWAVQTSAVQQFGEGESYDDNLWTRLIKEKLNIDVEVEFSADASTDAYRNKLNVLLASGEFPDVLRWGDNTFFKQAVDAGYVMSIEDVFNQYASDEVKTYREKYPDCFKGASVDGKLMAFPYMNDNFHQAPFLWIRDDWMENTNSTPPTTVDEMVELARKFTFEDPDGNGKDDTYGFTMQKNVVDGNFGSLMGLLAAYGAPAYGNVETFYRGDDGKITFGLLQPGVKDALAVVRKMYEDGLIDPEFIVEDVSTLETDFGEGKVGMTYHMNWGTWHPFNILYQNSGVTARPYPIPQVEGIEPKIGVHNNENGEYFMVSSKCENPDAIIKILNLFQEVVYSGNYEDGFSKYWTNEQYRLCPIYVGIPGELFAPELLPALEANAGDDLTGTILEYYNYVKGFEDGSLKDDTNAYGTWGQMFEGGSMAIALDYKDKGYLVTNLIASDIPDIWLQNSSTLGTMVDTAFTDIIVGNKPLDSFDQFVTDWLAAGGQQTLDELEKLYPAE